MSLNRLEERNCLKKLNYFERETRTNLYEINRNMQKISTELKYQQSLLEQFKNERRLNQLNNELDTLLRKRRVKSATTSVKVDFSGQENDKEGRVGG